MKKYICNPMNLPYKYQFIDTFGTKSVAREAADPSLVLFKGKYYLFPSMTGGFWYSDDLHDWKYKRTDELPVHDYAPDVRQIGEYLYFCASANLKSCSFFRTKDPLNEKFEEVEGSFPFWDPDMFQDDDGRVYHFWGSSNNKPLYGVELNPKDMTKIGEPVELLAADPAHGFERKGEDHILTNVRSELELKMLEILGKDPYIEGVWMTKHNGKYYLQYAAPGAQYNVYADGVYVADKPLGPYKYAENNPFSYKPGGFIPGAGHGSTLQDKAGNWWHISTMRISLSHRFERRLGLFPTGFDKDGEMFCNQRYADWVLPLPEDGKKYDIWQEPEWYLLSYKKAVKASSCAENLPAENAVDEDVRSWWKAKTNKSGEWLEIDLEKVCTVNAVQINFADDYIKVDFPDVELQGDEYMKRYIEQRPIKTRWLAEYSEDGKTYKTLCDKRNAETDLPHDLIVNENGIKARYIRVTFTEVPYNQPATICGLRVFGKAEGKAPAATEVTDYKFDSDIDLTLKWKQTDAVGYNILWGHKEDKLYHSYMVFGKNEQYIGGINAGQDIYVRIDTFNESGITHGKTIKIR